MTTIQNHSTFMNNPGETDSLEQSRSMAAIHYLARVRIDAYKDWHDEGFEILGISFDRENMEEKIVAFTEQREMRWPHIYDGEFWDAAIGRMHDVSGIPFVLLVDGDTHKILASPGYFVRGVRQLKIKPRFLSQLVLPRPSIGNLGLRSGR